MKQLQIASVVVLVCALPLQCAGPMEISEAVQGKAKALNIEILKAEVGSGLGHVKIELRNAGTTALKNLRIEAEHYNNKGIVEDEFKARRDVLAPGETWVASDSHNSRGRVIKHWTITDISGEK